MHPTITKSLYLNSSIYFPIHVSTDKNLTKGAIMHNWNIKYIFPTKICIFNFNPPNLENPSAGRKKQTVFKITYTPVINENPINKHLGA